VLVSCSGHIRGIEFNEDKLVLLDRLVNCAISENEQAIFFLKVFCECGDQIEAEFKEIIH
jgi:hypothetical protein